LDELRAAAAGQRGAPEVMAPYLAKVRERAYAVTDADVRALREAGYSEDDIFERTVEVSVAEGRRRQAAAEAVIR
jgi:alkylhydroperoxidase family enzyme